MVCAWRAIVLWKYDRRVVVILSTCIVGTFGSCPLYLVPLKRRTGSFPAVSIYDLKLALMNEPGPNAGHGIDEGKVAAIVVGPMLGTNILSTSLIAWKAWYANSPLLPSGLLTTPPKGIPQNRQRTPQEGQSLRSRGESTRAPNRVGSRVLSLMGKSVSCSSLWTHWSKTSWQVFYLLTAFRVLPGSGSYTVNLVMLFLSVRMPPLLSDHLG